MSIYHAVLQPALDRLSFGTDMTDEDQEAFLSLPFTLRSFDREDYLIRVGDESGGCRTLLSGFTCRHRTVSSGARQILSLYLRGDFLDLDGALLKLAADNVQALTSCEVAFIPREAILDLVARLPNIGRAFWRATLVEASVARQWALNIGLLNARQRVANLLCELLMRQEAAGLGAGASIVWPLTQEHISEAAGMTPIHANRILGSLRKEKLVATANRSVTILDLGGLRAVGGFNPNYLHLLSTGERAEPLVELCDLSNAASTTAK